MTVVATIKGVVVGDTGVGKTSLLIVHNTDKFPDEFVPSVFDTYAITTMIGDEPVTFGLYDTASREDYDRLRPLTYDRTDVFFVCFSIVSPTSYENCREKWFPEVHHHVPKSGGVACLLVGLKADLQYDPATLEELKKKKQTPISKAAGEALATEMGARKYLEVSALTRYGVKNLFEEAVIAALEPPSSGDKKKRECVIL